MFRKLLRERFDKGDDVVELLMRWLETALAVLRDDELVATDACAAAVRANIGRITQAVTFVQVIACVNQYVLNVQPLQKVIVCQFSVFHFRMSLFVLSYDAKILCAFQPPHGSSVLQSSLLPHPSVSPRPA